MDKLGKRIKERRAELNITQTQLASAAKMTPAAISQFESGSRMPSFDSLSKLSEVLKVSTDYLIGKTDIGNAGLDGNAVIESMMKGLIEFSDKDIEILYVFYQYLSHKSMSTPISGKDIKNQHYHPNHESELQERNLTKSDGCNLQTNDINDAFHTVKNYEELIGLLSDFYLHDQNSNRLTLDKISTTSDPNSVNSFIEDLMPIVFKKLVFVKSFENMTLSQIVNSIGRLADNLITDVIQLVLQKNKTNVSRNNQKDKFDEIDDLLNLLGENH